MEAEFAEHREYLIERVAETDEDLTLKYLEGEKITKEELIQQRGDLSPFLIHLTRTGRIRKYKDIYNLSDNHVENFSFSYRDRHNNRQ